MSARNLSYDVLGDPALLPSKIACPVRPTADNVVVVLAPLPTRTAGGIELPQRSATDRREARLARVLAVGPGAWHRTNRREALATHGLADDLYHFVPNELEPGDLVLVDAVSGAQYDLDLDVPRHNVQSDFAGLAGARAEFRIVREQGEVLARVEL